MTKIIGMDPALSAFGITVFRSEVGRVEPVQCEVVKTKVDKSAYTKTEDVGRRMREIFTRVRVVCESDGIRPDAICVEEPIIMGPSVITIARLHRVRGLVDSLAEVWNVPVFGVHPHTLLRELTGDPKAGKERVRAAVEREYPGIVKLYPKHEDDIEHVTDAAGAVIVTIRMKTLANELQCRLLKAALNT